MESSRRTTTCVLLDRKPEASLASASDDDDNNDDNDDDDGESSLSSKLFSCERTSLLSCEDQAGLSSLRCCSPPALDDRVTNTTTKTETISPTGQRIFRSSAIAEAAVKASAVVVAVAATPQQLIGDQTAKPTTKPAVTCSTLRSSFFESPCLAVVDPPTSNASTASNGSHVAGEIRFTVEEYGTPMSIKSPFTISSSNSALVANRLEMKASLPASTTMEHESSQVIRFNHSTRHFCF